MLALLGWVPFKYGAALSRRAEGSTLGDTVMYCCSYTEYIFLYFFITDFIIFLASIWVPHGEGHAYFPKVSPLGPHATLGEVLP